MKKLVALLSMGLAASGAASATGMRFDAAIGFADQRTGSDVATHFAATWPLHPELGLEIAVGHGGSSPRSVVATDFTSALRATYRVDRYTTLGLRYQPEWRVGNWSPFARAGWVYANGEVEQDYIATDLDENDQLVNVQRIVFEVPFDEDGGFVAAGLQRAFRQLDLTLQVQYLPISVGKLEAGRIDLLVGIGWRAK